MIERTQIGFPRVEDGRYLLRVLGVPVKKRFGETPVREWSFEVSKDQIMIQKIKIIIPPWKSEGLLLALGGKKEKNEIVWDDSTVEGKYFEADLKWEKYTKSSGETGEGYTLSRCEKSF